MATRILGPAEIRRLLPMSACMELVEQALRSLTAGNALNPLRWILRVPGRSGMLGMMPGFLDSPETLGLKVLAVCPDNHGTRYDSHQGLVVLFHPQYGYPEAILDASEITAIRTAAASGVATRALAGEDAGDVAILGSGVQARTHLEAMLHACKLRRIRVYSPTAENRQSFARRESSRHGIEVEAMNTARQAVDGADVICVVTSSSEPVLLGEWIAAGAHINAVGASIPTARELDTPAVASSRMYVDRKESAFHESGDFLIAREEGAIDDDHLLGEIGDVLLGRVAGRTTDDQITLFKSLGVAVEDLAAAHYVLERAVAEDLGQSVDLGGLRAAD